MRTLALGLAACLLALGALGCGLLRSPIDPTHGLEGAQKRFSRSLRWGDWHAASEYVAREQREAFLDAAEELEDVRLTDYELLSMELGDDEHTGTVRVRYKGHPVSQPVERSVELVEEWHREREGHGWRVEVPLVRLRSGLRTAAR